MPCVIYRIFAKQKTFVAAESVGFQNGIKYHFDTIRIHYMPTGPKTGAIAFACKRFVVGGIIGEFAKIFRTSRPNRYLGKFNVGSEIQAYSTRGILYSIENDHIV